MLLRARGGVKGARTYARSDSQAAFPRDGARESRQARTRSTGLFVRVVHITRKHVRGARLLDLNQCVHDKRRGCPAGVTVRAAFSC